MLGDAISYPRNGEDWLKTTLIGGVLLILSFLIVPIFIVQGYFVRVLRSSAKGEEEPPVFDEWGELIVDGLKAFVISLVYVGVPLAIAFVVMLVLGIGGAAAGGDAGAGLSILGMLFGLVMLVVVMAAVYALPAALANFAYNDSFGDAFDFGEVVDTAMNMDYFVPWLLALVVAIVGGFIAQLLAIIIVGIFLSFYVNVSVFYLYGQAYAQSRDLGGSTSETAAAI